MSLTIKLGDLLSFKGQPPPVLAKVRPGSRAESIRLLSAKCAELRALASVVSSRMIKSKLVARATRGELAIVRLSLGKRRGPWLAEIIRVLNGAD